MTPVVPLSTVPRVVTRTEPFTTAGLAPQPSDMEMAVSVSLAYEQRSLSGTAHEPLETDPNVPAAPHPLRLAIHAVSTFVVVVAAGLAMIAIAPRLFGFGSTVVTSGSMEPSIQVADVVVTAPTDGEFLGAGAVINFARGDGAVLHRITNATPSGYETTGDANRVADSQLVVPDDILGVGVVVVPLVGLPRLWVDQGKWLHLAVIGSLLTVAMHTSRVRWVHGKKQRWSR